MYPRKRPLILWDCHIELGTRSILLLVLTHESVASVVKKCGLIDIEAEHTTLDPESNFPI